MFLSDLPCFPLIHCVADWEGSWVWEGGGLFWFGFVWGLFVRGFLFACFLFFNPSTIYFSVAA